MSAHRIMAFGRGAMSARRLKTTGMGRAAGFRRRITAIAAICALAAAPAMVVACPTVPGMASTQTANVSLIFTTRPSPVLPGEPFEMDVSVCPNAAGVAVQALRVDAWMPLHRHGMNYKTRVIAAGNGRFQVSGLLFHMPGRWEILFDVTLPDATERASAIMDLP